MCALNDTDLREVLAQIGTQAGIILFEPPSVSYKLEPSKSPFTL